MGIKPWVCGMHEEPNLARLSVKMQSLLRRRRRTALARALQSPALRMIRIVSPSEASVQQALQDLGREPALRLNDEHLASHDFVAALGSLCAAEVEAAQALRDMLVARLSRTSSGADAFKFVNKLLGIEAGSNDCFVKQREAPLEAPSLELRRNGDGELAARITCVNKFAIHRFDDAVFEPFPIDTVVFDELDVVPEADPTWRSRLLSISVPAC